MHFTKFGRNGHNSKDKNIVNFINVFFLHSFEKGEILRLNKLESPLPKDGLFQIWLILVQWSWRGISYKIRWCIFQFRNYLPFGKELGTLFAQLESPPLKNDFCQVRLKFDQWLWRRRKYEAFTDKRTDGRPTTGGQKNSLELLAPTSWRPGRNNYWYNS